MNASKLSPYAQHMLDLRLLCMGCDCAERLKLPECLRSVTLIVGVAEPCGQQCGGARAALLQGSILLWLASMIIRFNHRADNSDIWISGIASPIDSLAAIPVRRVALCLHGRIGIWRVRASHIDDAEVVWKANAPHRWREAPKHMDRIDVAEHTALVGFATFGHSSLYRHVVAPNRAAGIDIDVFLHSWHAEIGMALDAMYRPVASKHELVKHNLHPVRSQHLSMRTVLAFVAASGRHYDMTMMLRYDLLFFRPFLLARLGTHTALAAALVPAVPAQCAGRHACARRVRQLAWTR